MTVSVLRWAGSKRQILPALAKYWRGHARYVEPFVGSATLFFHLSPSRAILGDINKDLINALRQIKRDHEGVFLSLRSTRKSERDYYRIRSEFNSGADQKKRAAQFIYLNRFCFNGLYRTNEAGEFNVPYGAFKSGQLPTKRQLIDCANALQKARLLAGDFEKTLSRTKRGDFVYLDPPYQVGGTRVFSEYDASVFTVNDLQRLRAALLTLKKIGASFLLSYIDSAEGRSLSRGFNVESVTVRRCISGFVGSRSVGRELLISWSAA